VKRSWPPGSSNADEKYSSASEMHVGGWTTRGGQTEMSYSAA
jgi:hypothetical protein